MKKKIMKTLLALFATLACSFGVMGMAACKESGDSSKAAQITLVDFENEEIEVAYGKTYSLELMALDSNGKYQAVSASVKTTAGEAVNVVNGKLLVADKGGYVVEYTFNSYKRTVTLKVVAGAEPVISVNGSDATLLTEQTYTIPEYSVVDYYEGPLTGSYAVYKKATTQGEEDVKLAHNEADGTITFTEVGEYYVLYTATNAHNVTARKKVAITVIDTIPEIVTVNESNHTAMANNEVKTNYVAAGSDELKNFGGGYTGNAKRFVVANNSGYRLTNKFTVDDLTFLKEHKGVTGVSLWIAMSGIPQGKVFFKGSDNCLAKGGWTWDDVQIGTVEGGNASETDTVYPCDTWYKIIVPINDYIALATPTDGSAKKSTITLFELYPDGFNFTTTSAYVYVGDIAFDNTYTPTDPESPEPEPPTQTDGAIIDLTTNVGAYAFYDGASWISSKAVTTPVDGITGDYSGAIVQMQNGTNRVWYFKAFDAAKLATVKTLATQYNTVSLWVLSAKGDGFKAAVDVADKAEFIDYCTSKTEVGKEGTEQGVRIGDKTWTKISISSTDFLAFLETEQENDGYYRLWKSAGVWETGTLYFGDMFFENVDA